EVEELFDNKYQNNVWYINSETLTKYKQFFDQADVDKDKYVNGQEAMTFFLKSKLDKQILAKLWNLVDSNKTGKLDEYMFYSMFHMVFKIVQSKNQLPIPSKLPECLSVDILKKLGTNITKTIKQTRIVQKEKPRRYIINKTKQRVKKPKKFNNTHRSSTPQPGSQLVSDPSPQPSNQLTSTAPPQSFKNDEFDNFDFDDKNNN